MCIWVFEIVQATNLEMTRSLDRVIFQRVHWRPEISHSIRSSTFHFFSYVDFRLK